MRLMAIASIEKVCNCVTEFCVQWILVDLYLRRRFCFEDMKIGSQWWGETGVQARRIDADEFLCPLQMLFYLAHAKRSREDRRVGVLLLLIDE